MNKANLLLAFLAGQHPAWVAIVVAMKRLFLLILLLAAILSVGTVVAQSLFPDVPEDHPHYDAIQWSQQVGAFRGYEDGTFKPDQKITAEQATIVFGRVYPDGVSRAEFAGLLYAGRALLSESVEPETTTNTTVPTEEPLWSTGRWRHFQGETAEGKYEGYYLQAIRPVGLYSHESTPDITIRCGIGNDEWDGVYFFTPWLIFNHGFNREYVDIHYRTDSSELRTIRGLSDEDGDSAVFIHYPQGGAWSQVRAARQAFLSDLGNLGEGKLWVTIDAKYDDRHMEFSDILGIRGVLQRLDCWDR